MTNTAIAPNFVHVERFCSRAPHRSPTTLTHVSAAIRTRPNKWARVRTTPAKDGIDLELLERRARSCRAMRADGDDGVHEWSKRADQALRNGQLRRRASPEKITGRGRDDGEIGTEAPQNLANF